MPTSPPADKKPARPPRPRHQPDVRGTGRRNQEGIPDFRSGTKRKQEYFPDFSLITELNRAGYTTIIGVDEVGRGALAGPVVVAAVQVNTHVAGVADSKQIPITTRTALADKLRSACSVIRFGQASCQEIDTLGMAAALRIAYERALQGVTADLVLTDHIKLPTNHRFIRATLGDSLFYPVAAASIIAKTYRDQLMRAYHAFYPEYGWESNVGYGTAFHFEALQQHGYSPLHRTSFHTKRR